MTTPSYEKHPDSDATSPPVVVETSAGRGRNIVTVRLINLPDEEQQRASDMVVASFLRQKAPFAVIMDLRALTSYPTTQREMYARGRLIVRDVYKAHHRITVYVVNDDKQRGFLTAIGWQVPSTRNSGPRLYTDSMDEAVAQCRRALAEQ
jgi:hypothetical protein